MTIQNRTWGNRRRRPGLAVAAAAVLATTILTPTHAQTPGGTIAGQVVDPDGNPLRAVAVVATRPGATEPQWLGLGTTDGRGRYRIPNLPAGTYALTFWLPGFGGAARHDVEVRVSSTRVVDFQLGPGVEPDVPITVGPPRVTIRAPGSFALECDFSPSGVRDCRRVVVTPRVFR